MAFEIYVQKRMNEMEKWRDDDGGGGDGGGGSKQIHNTNIHTRRKTLQIKIVSGWRATAKES